MVEVVGEGWAEEGVEIEAEGGEGGEGFSG